MAKPYSSLCIFSVSLYCYFFSCLAISSKKNITTDEYALLAFKSSITLDPFHMLSNWSISSSTSCNWLGVTCDERHGRVRALNLGNMDLKGTISPQLGNLSFLVDLDLNGNSFHGELPHELLHLKRLKLLNLSNNDFLGEIPSRIGYLSKLQYLHLGYNNFVGFIPQSIFNLSMLEYLNLKSNLIEGTIPKTVSNMSALEEIYLRNNSLSGLPNLRTLYLYYNDFSGEMPKIWSYCNELEDLELTGIHFDKGHMPPDIGKLTKLQYLYLPSTNLYGSIPMEIGHLNQLQTLQLANNRYLAYLDISGNRLTKLPKSIGNSSLERFRAYSCGINGNIPLEIGNMSNLIELSLSGNDLNGSIPSTIKRSHQLQYLDLGYNGLQGSIVHELCEVGSLRFNKLTSVIPFSFWNLNDILEVNLTSNALIGNLPLEIKNLRALTLLDLSKNQISSNIPTAISLLRTLETLSLANNKLNGSIPTSLGEMFSLSFLDLSQNLITGVIPKSFESLSSLKYINLSYNRLQGEIPEGGPFKSFTAQSFMHNDALCGNPRLQVPLCMTKSKKKKLFIKFILPVIVVLGILVVACIILGIHKKKKVENPHKSDLSATLGVPRRISYYELVKATNGFGESNLLGRGGFGSVYRGILSSGKIVAIKVLDLTLEATSKSFDAECNAMRNLRHRNLVQVISSCSNDDFKSLVMEFMSNGSVEKWLYSENYCLNFLQRLNIMIDVASALEYLHHGSSIPVVHCDLKPSNVLLDEDMVAHVSDFGISKLLDEGQSKTHTQTLATLGYVAPEYGSKGVISVKGDVYSYGIMLMEMFTGKKPTNEMFSEELTLKTWISESMVNSVMEVVDYNLVSQHEKELHEILVLALSCCADSPEARIKMTDVTASLIKIKTLVMR
ncbi:hypothetical protein TSUD_384380 [Trifolium subterraneum]|uniref:non-specific serine/threonine protein kinase n=1 Tax=Trifolium subterraneum TaxID=3900 RepID=A0A2Z6N052_TRISU|nr:hypothetical protein TSUD_384380 [Trifolium subterraneum]